MQVEKRTTRRDRGGRTRERGKSAEVAANVAWNRNGGIAITLPKRFKAARPRAHHPRLRESRRRSPRYIEFFSSALLPSFTLSPRVFSRFNPSCPSVLSPFLFIISSPFLRYWCLTLALGGRSYYIFGEDFAVKRGWSEYVRQKRRCKCKGIEIGKPRQIYCGKKRVRIAKREGRGRTVFSSHDRVRAASPAANGES